MKNYDYENTRKILLGAGFSPELVNQNIEISQKGGNPTAQEQEKLDQLKAEIIDRLKR